MTNRGPGRTFPAAGTVGQVPTVDEAGNTTWIDAGAAAFVPDEETDWDPVPETVQEALDQLAARVTALEP